MKFRNWSIITCAVLALSALAMAQDKSASSDDTAAPKEYSLGKGNRSLFGDLLSAHLSMATSFQFLTTYDDNVFLDNTFRKNAAVSRYAGRFTLGYREQHTRFEATYMPEYSMNYRYSPLTSMSHAYNHSLRHQFTPHTEVFWDFQGSYAPATGQLPFRYIRFFGFTYAIFSLEALEPSANILNGGTTVGISHKFNSRWQLVGDLRSATTKFKQIRVTNAPGALKGQNYSFGTNLALSYQLSERRSVGVSANHSYLGVINPNSHQQTQSVQATFSQTLARGYVVTLGLGPSFTERPGARAVELGLSYNATFGRQMERFGFNFNAGKTFQAGLQAESVSADTVAFNVNKRVGQRWSGVLGGAYSRSQSPSGGSSSENINGFTQISYQVTRNIGAFTTYNYLHQKALGSTVTLRNMDRNAVSVGLSYTFVPFSGR